MSAGSDRLRIQGDVALVTLTKGYVAVIDACDAEIVGQWCWSAAVMRSGVYARRNASGKHLSLHRMLVDCPVDRVVDHVDGDTLNNRRSNLRIATVRQNAWNVKKPSLGISGVRGVSWSKLMMKWRADIRVGDKKKTIGFYPTKAEAAAAYEFSARRHRGSFHPEALVDAHRE